MDKMKSAAKALCHPWTHMTFVRDDVSGFVQLFFDNCSTVLLLINLLLSVVWVPSSLSFKGQNSEFVEQVKSTVAEKANNTVWGLVIPGLAITMVFGNVYYAWLACRLSYATGRFRDVAALPFGINTPAAFGFVFSILLPAFSQAATECDKQLEATPGMPASEFAACLSAAVDSSWQTGVVCNFLGGLIGVGLGFFGTWIARVTPVGALLSSLATIGISFLLITSVSAAFQDPISGLVPLLLMAVGYLSGVTYDPIPTALAIVLAGTALGWANQAVTAADVSAAAQYVQWTGVGTGVQALGHWDNVPQYVGVVIPFAIQAAVGTLMNVQSAKSAGDSYPVRESMVVDGCGSIVGAVFGTPFMTTVYIGHPSYKKIGATMGYSILNCVVFFVVSVTGLFAVVNAVIPSSAITPVIAFVGLVICKEAIDSMPSRLSYVFLLGLLPGICDWAVQGGVSFAVQREAFFGVYAISRSSILFAMVLCSIGLYTMNREFIKAAGWSVFGALASSVGLLHQGTMTLTNYALPSGAYCVSRVELGIEPSGACPVDYVDCAGDDAGKCGFLFATRWRFAVGYLMVAALLGLFWVLQRHTDCVDGPVCHAEECKPRRSESCSSASEDADRVKPGKTSSSEPIGAQEGPEGADGVAAGRVDEHALNQV